ncbi:DUF6691 family protein [Novosphingobium mangrovi (ex Huang et al. 2023)]|uniref:YeeE/YedE family protein n=1 Tax=Novosphingobium mangrovi (ex Huang et al. 2023) TaxID=2976432 RepID=A0ABT2I1V6_9SPHN|nr:DUF6691 family protein [Novosphingobium mangrovi (ex Huang et al. 2023)]MCT2398778.1 YeeE/YedE family protein [Novosphingobium mangrovi (ex Huang et al. 2023)]
MRLAIGFVTGLLFGFGLLLAGMTSPDKVRAFLDIAGAWDPSLAFVMGGAVMTAMPLFALARRRAKPVAGALFDRPSTTMIDRKLVIGSLTFGIGWGLAGICPGPALVALAIVPSQTLAFVIPMIAGLMVSAAWRRSASGSGVEALQH